MFAIVFKELFLSQVTRSYKVVESFHLLKLHFALFYHFARYLTCLRELRAASPVDG